MSKTIVEVTGLHELQERMAAFPVELAKASAVTMAGALLTLHENVPPYPDPPEDSTYIRTGTLGRSLGASIGGGSSGEPDIFTIKKIGSGFEGKFGSHLNYAQYVIGDDTQAAVHSGRWWNMRFIANRASLKIERLFAQLGEKLAAFLEGKGL